VSAIADVLAAIDTVIERVTQAQTSAAGAASAASDALGRAQALGATGTVASLTQVHETIEAASEKIAAVVGSVEQARRIAEALAHSP
jgi:hypothetical protein